MALKKSITTDSLVHVDGAYHRVEGVAHPSKCELKFHVRSYVMKDAIDENGVQNRIPHEVFFSERVVVCDFKIDAASAWDQAYTYLKTLPEFADAVDC